MTLLHIALSFMLLLAATGCTHPRYGLNSCLPRGNDVAIGEETVLSLRYRVRTDAGKPAAHEVDRFMERTAALWIPLFGVPDPATLPLEIRLYREPSTLTTLLANQKLTSKATGVYLPTTPPAIHVACTGDEPGHPYRTLLHEGTHQFIHLGTGYREPGRPTATPRLTLPLWLNEGLASYYEAAFITPDLLQPGRPDPARLNELQTALRRDQVPPLAKLLTKRYGESFSSLDYAIAWGVVYALMQEAPPPWAADGRQWLKNLVDESRRGWLMTPASPPPANADDPRWWATVTDRTRASFDNYLADRNLSLPDWEAQWRDWILAHP